MVLVQSVLRMSLLYGAFNRLTGPGGGEISQLLTLGNGMSQGSWGRGLN